MASSQDQFASLKNAVLGASAIQSPSSTLGASQAPELAQLYQSSFQLPASSSAAGAAAGVAGDIVEQQRRAAAIAAQKKAEAEQKARDLSDPNKYRQVKKPDGGYDFFAPDGSQVDIATLTQRTGTKPSDWLKDSENPIDIQYLQDQQNLSNYIKAKLGGDKVTVQKYETNKPELSKYQGQGGAAKLLDDFKNYYRRYFTPRSVNPQAWGYNPGSNPFVPAPYDPTQLGLGDTSIGDSGTFVNGG